MKKKNNLSTPAIEVTFGIPGVQTTEDTVSSVLAAEEESIVLLQPKTPSTDVMPANSSVSNKKPILLLDDDSDEDLILLAPSQRISPSQEELEAARQHEQNSRQAVPEEFLLSPIDAARLDSTELPTDPLVVAASSDDLPSHQEDIRATQPAAIPPVSGTHLKEVPELEMEIPSTSVQHEVAPNLLVNVDMTQLEEVAVVDEELVVESIPLEEVEQPSVSLDAELDAAEELGAEEELDGTQELTADDLVLTSYSEPAVVVPESDVDEGKTLSEKAGLQVTSHAQDVLSTLSEEVRRVMETTETPLHMDAVGENAKATVERGSYQEPASPVLVQRRPRDEVFESGGHGTIRSEDGALLRSSPMMIYEGKLSRYTLVEVLEREPDRILWQAMDATQESRSLLVEELSHSRYRKGFKRLPDLTGTVIQTPLETLELEDRVLVVFEQPVGERLSEIIDDLQYAWDLPQVIQFCKPIAETLIRLHEQHLLFLQLSLENLWIQEDGQPLVTQVECLYSGKTPFHLRPVVVGFTAPEVFDRDFQLDRRADVFAMAMLFHYMISRCQPFNHLHIPNVEIPSPRIFDLRFPVSLIDVFARAWNPKVERRTPSISAFLEQLDKQWQALEVRQNQEFKPLELEVGHDLHIGIRKGKRNPVNQDALFWRYDKERGKGLFVVADGVSVCQYGSGDKASSLVIQVARKRWETLLDKPIFDQPFTQAQRHQVLRSIMESANKAIAQEINRTHDAIHGFVEDVMGSTCVAAFVDGPNITIACLGDSRAMLKTSQFVETINVDHNFKTFQMQSLEDMETIHGLTNGALLTRCVGSFRKDEDSRLLVDELHPDFFDFQLIPGDTVVLCSDGLTDYAGTSEEEKRESIDTILEMYPDPLASCFWLVALANQNGGGDNISVIVIKVPE